MQQIKQPGLHALQGPRVGHLVSLKNLGGVERFFSRFYTLHASAYDHHVLLQTDELHNLLKPQYAPYLPDRLHSIKGSKSFKIPKFLTGLRSRYQARLIDELGIEAILVWNKIAHHPLAFPDSVPVVHFERGSAWLAEGEPSMQRYLARLDGVLCNSYAGLRFLQLKWGLRSDIPSRVLQNAIRLPERHASHPEGRFRLGFAARMTGLKAPMVALETFAELLKERPDAEFWVAGEGPIEPIMRDYAKRWGIDKSVRFCGLVGDMTGFYSELDAFICPSWREPFGNVVQEALAHGLPTLVGSVDGLPELVSHGDNGAVLKPSRDRRDLGRYGKQCLQGPDEVYSPSEDSIVSAGILDPEEAATVLAGWADSPEWRRQMAAEARARVLRDFNLDDYGHELVGFMREVIGKA